MPEPTKFSTIAVDLRGHGKSAKAGADLEQGDYAAMIADLEVLPRRLIPYKGRLVPELDLDEALARRPSLLIVDPPTAVGAGEDFTLQVSTRNLVRDRFLGAAAGGYYRESSFLNAEGIQRGHFHTACRLLGDLSVAPDAQPAPAFFLATQDNGGGSEPDLVGVPVTGLDEPGTYQCAVWAGDGSHRLPMMQRANQTPAFDMVRIEVG